MAGNQKPLWDKMMFQCRQPYANAAQKDIEEVAEALPVDQKEKLFKAIKELRSLEFQDGRDDTQFNGW